MKLMLAWVLFFYGSALYQLVPPVFIGKKVETRFNPEYKDERVEPEYCEGVKTELNIDAKQEWTGRIRFLPTVFDKYRVAPGTLVKYLD
ncbi:MAG: hypothetical protein ACOCQB_03450 [Halanaerobiaceae bacterium]